MDPEKQLAHVLWIWLAVPSSLPCTNIPLLTIPESVRSWPSLPRPSQFPDPPTVTPKSIFGPWCPCPSGELSRYPNPHHETVLGNPVALSESQEVHTTSTFPTPVMPKAISQVNWRENLVTIAFTVNLGKHSAVKSLFLFLLQILIYLALCQAVCWQLIQSQHQGLHLTSLSRIRGGLLFKPIKTLWLLHSATQAVLWF